VNCEPCYADARARGLPPSRCQPPPPPPPPPPPTYGVGVLPAGGGCPPGSSEEVGLHFDSEDNDPETSLIGNYQGNATLVGNKNLILRFCRVDGTKFRNLGSSDSVYTNYAVLKLGNTCPPGSVHFPRKFDTEDDDNANRAYGNVAPNTWAGNITLHFCLFAGGSTPAPSLPTFGGSYGVFAGGEFISGTAFGHVFTDDEDTNNANGYWVSNSNYVTAAQRIIKPTARNTDLFMARVSP
jgi:hypothetical protein